MSNISSLYVPPAGPLDADVMLVGEAPGADEEAEGAPFVGMAGQFMERYISRAGYPWSQVFRTNLSKNRPKGNKFVLLNDTPELEAGLKELSEEIEKVNPNLIVSAGAWPMYYLTGLTATKGKPGTGITNWRGSIVEGSGQFVPAMEGRKVLISYHPSYVMRPQGFGNHPVFFVDLKKIPGEAGFPEIKRPYYHSYIDPANLILLAKEMMRSEWLTVDIETFGNSLACIGFADSVERGLCITYECPGGWEAAQMLLAGDQKKIFQYGAFDINYLHHHYGWVTNGYAYDTYIAAANLMPELPKGLDFLTSIYTPFPYYKTDRKTWKQAGDQRILWEYNIKDVIATHWVAMEQMKELETLYEAA